jgi:hypothetical protein
LFHFIYKGNIEVLHFWDDRKENLPTWLCVGFVNIPLHRKSASLRIGNAEIVNDVNSFCGWTRDWHFWRRRKHSVIYNVKQINVRWASCIIQINWIKYWRRSRNSCKHVGLSFNRSICSSLSVVHFFNIDNNDHGYVILATRIRIVFSNVFGLIANLSKRDEYATSSSSSPYTPNLGVSIYFEKKKNYIKRIQIP